MPAVSTTNGNSVRLIGRRIAIWFTLLAVGLSGAGSALATCCSPTGIGSSCCASSLKHFSSEHSHEAMGSMGCHDSADDGLPEVSSAACGITLSAVSPELVEEGRLASQRHSVFSSGLSFVSWRSGESALLPPLLPKARPGNVTPPTARQRLPVDPLGPLRI
jgi:hypothetical protein